MNQHKQKLRKTKPIKNKGNNNNKIRKKRRKRKEKLDTPKISTPKTQAPNLTPKDGFPNMKEKNIERKKGIPVKIIPKGQLQHKEIWKLKVHLTVIILLIKLCPLTRLKELKIKEEEKNDIFYIYIIIIK